MPEPSKGPQSQSNTTTSLNDVSAVVAKKPELLLDHFDVEYERNGEKYLSVCPVHEGSDRHGAFSFSSKFKNWVCWTHECHKDYGNNIFGLVRGLLSKRTGEPTDFKDALHYIANLYNINLSSPKDKLVVPNSPETDFVRMVKKLNNKLDIKNVELQDDCPTIGSSPYFEARDFEPGVLKYFGVEDCLDQKHKFSGRAVIPVHDSEGKRVANIARATQDWMNPKYLFTDGFQKTNYLYNHHRAIPYAQQKSCLFIVEGQGDVWRMFESGVNNCVGVFGKSLSDAQKKLLLKSGVTTLVILLDPDQAGREGKFKLQRDLHRYFTLKFPTIVRHDLGKMDVQQIDEKILSNVRGLY